MANPKVRNLPGFPLEYAALGLLMSGPKHGYQLYQDFCGEFHLIWKAGQAAFYAALAMLEGRGLLMASAEPHEGRPPRKVYSITDKGRADFMEWLQRPVTPLRAFRVEFVARLRFFSLLHLPGARALIARQVELLQGLLDEWEHAAISSSAAPGDPFPEAVYDLRKRQAQAMIAWLLAWQGRFEVESVSIDS